MIDTEQQGLVSTASAYSSLNAHKAMPCVSKLEKSHEIFVASISAKCSLTSSAAVHVDLMVHDVQWPFNEPLH